MTEVGPKSTRVVCGQCHQQLLTRVEGKSTTKTHLLALVLCSICLCPCAIALYFTDCARNTDHYCSSCNKYIGTYKR